MTLLSTVYPMDILGHSHSFHWGEKYEQQHHVSKVPYSWTFRYQSRIGAFIFTDFQQLGRGRDLNRIFDRSIAY